VKSSLQEWLGSCTSKEFNISKTKEVNYLSRTVMISIYFKTPNENQFLDKLD